MISSARIYLLEVQYQNKTWLSITDCDKLSGMIANLIKTRIPALTFKNLQFYNTYESVKNITSCEIHINKLKYNEQRVLTKDDISVIRRDLKKYLMTIPHFTFTQVHVINDEFSGRITPLYLPELQA